MKLKDMKNLVICSTLNQITNYLIIKKINPEKILNITYDEDIQKTCNKNMKNSAWDKYLTLECNRDFPNIKFDNFTMKREELYDIEAFRTRIKEKIKETFQNEPIAWHITGGQRFIALAIYKIVEDRKKQGIVDKIIYVEGNEEKLMVFKESKLDEEKSLEYYDDNLRIDKILKLAGFSFDENINCNSSLVRVNGNLQLEKGDQKEFEKENKFYTKLYEFMTSEQGKDIKFEFKSEYNLNNNSKKTHFEDSFRDLLIISNSVKNSIRKNEDNKHKERERYKFLIEVYTMLTERFPKVFNELEYDFINSKELSMHYPAGYIFEKLVFHKVYNEVKYNKKIIQIVTSLKAKSKINNERNCIIDELDIALLTNTGKIVNIECKSGDMSGDNAKSTKYTTYSLSGVFGTPILASPLYGDEDKNSNLKYSFSAKGAAERAQLNILFFDSLDKIKDYI